jgi:predicted nucleic acid-binding protein
MKAILEFDLPEESKDHLLAANGHTLALVIYEFDELLHRLVKYDECTKYKTVEEALVALRDELRDIINQRGLTMDMFD